MNHSTKFLKNSSYVLSNVLGVNNQHGRGPIGTFDVMRAISIDQGTAPGAGVS